MPENNTLIAKLEKQQEELKRKIKAAKKAQLRKEAEHARKKAAIIGAAVLAEIEQNPDWKQQVDHILDKHTTSESDRKILGLAPRISQADDERAGDAEGS